MNQRLKKLTSTLYASEINLDRKTLNRLAGEFNQNLTNGLDSVITMNTKDHDEYIIEISGQDSNDMRLSLEFFENMLKEELVGANNTQGYAI